MRQKIVPGLFFQILVRQPNHCLYAQKYIITLFLLHLDHRSVRIKNPRWKACVCAQSYCGLMVIEEVPSS